MRVCELNKFLASFDTSTLEQFNVILIEIYRNVDPHLPSILLIVPPTLFFLYFHTLHIMFLSKPICIIRTVLLQLKLKLQQNIFLESGLRILICPYNVEKIRCSKWQLSAVANFFLQYIKVLLNKSYKALQAFSIYLYDGLVKEEVTTL